MAEIIVKLVNGELAGKTAQGLAKDVNAAALAYRKATIGTQEWIDAHGKLEKAKQLQADYKKQVDATTAASDTMKKSFMGVLNQIPIIGQLSSSLSAAKGGVGGLTSGFGTLKTAIASTGIGLIVVAVAALISAFSKFTPLIDKVEQILSGISAVISELLQRFQNFGTAIWGIVTGSTSMSEGLDKASDSFDGMGKSMRNAYEAGVQLKKLQQDLEDSARGIEVANARAEKQIEKLIVMSKNKGRTDQEQIDLLLKARKIAEENFQRNDKQKEGEFEALIKEAQTKSKLSKEEIIQLTEGTLAYETEYAKRGTIEDDLLDKIKESLIERINAEGQTGKLLEKIQNAENARLEKLDSAREKAAEKERKRQEELAKAHEKQMKDEADARENIAQLKVKLIEDDLERELAGIAQETEEKIAALKGSEQQIADQMLLLMAVRDQAIQEKKDEFALKAAEKDKKQKEEQRKRDEDLAKDQKQIAEDKAKFAVDMQNLELSTAQQATGLLGDLLAKRIGDEKKAKAIRKTFSIVDIGINLAKELSANAVTAAANPLNAVTFGAAGAAQLVGLNTASIIRSAISTARVLAFRRGGIPDGVLHGPSHEQGGIPLVAEGREIIMSTGVYDNPKLRRMASAINVAGGGRSFASGGPVNPFQDRAPISSGSSTSSSAAAGDSSDLRQYIGSLIDAMDRRIDRIEVVNYAMKTDKTGYQDQVEVVNKIRKEADV
jgi:hypothetical protein